MQADVFDSYATGRNGKLLHFDVLVPSGTSPETALAAGRAFLEGLGESPDGLQQSRCNFCHVETVPSEVETVIRTEGHFILPLDGCPTPFKGATQ